MKFTSIFFLASAMYIRGLPQIFSPPSEKSEVYFNIFRSECNVYSRFAANFLSAEREI